MSDAPGIGRLPEAVPLFPLPNVVLFPRAVLPLHIFEERYKQMMSDVLRGHRQIAMALLHPGWEKNYYGKPAVEPVVCVGSILSHERLADGRFNLLLQGHTRARIVREVEGRAYRLANLEAIVETGASEGDLLAARAQLSDMFERESYGQLPGGGQIRAMLRSTIPTAAIADLLAFNVLSDDQVAVKQALLAEADVKRRVWGAVEAVSSLRPTWQNMPRAVDLN
jgi:Lon protease-like protein